MARKFPSTAVGAYDDLGGVITVEWVAPNTPQEVGGDLVKLSGYLEDVHKPLLAAAAIAKADIKMRFDTETDPEGTEWQELNPEYLSWKTNHGYDPRILRKTGELEATATASAAFVVDADSLFYDTAGLPEYWFWMQEGTGDKGRTFGSTEELMKATAEGYTGLGPNTPPRPYIGTSAEAEAQIFEVFDLWFAEGIQIAISGSGTVQERGAGGKFGSTLYPDVGALV